jgi:hypothetical protein
MSRALDHAIINNLYDRPLLSGNQPIYEDLGKKIYLFQLNFRVSNGHKSYSSPIGATSENSVILKLGDMMDEDPQ